MLIENISAIDFQNGVHESFGDNTIAIQITDPCGWVPKNKMEFADIYHFEFLDLEDEFGDIGEFAITDTQAEDIVDILKEAYDRRMNVVVHCTAGICRSGAVVEVGNMMGFETGNNYRQPNVLVKSKLLKALGWTYDN